VSTAWQTVRVFISSTFRDMHAERDHLVKVVFPALRERLAPYRVHLVDIDLRWGVTREQAENHRVLGICLELIDACRPFFIGVLGERYGWVPPNFPTDVLTNFGWVKDAVGKSVTELEILYGVLKNPDMDRHAFFYFRDPAATASVPEPQRSEIFAATDSARAVLTELKNKIRAAGYPGLDPYPAKWDPAAFDRPTKSLGRFVGLEEFGRDVGDRLWGAIRTKLNLPEAPTPAADQATDEADLHLKFMESRLRVHVGREQLGSDLLAAAQSGGRFALLTGPAGSGKSASMARLVEDVGRVYPGAIVVPHFVGAGPRSTSGRELLHRFCETLQTRAGIKGPFPDEVDRLASAFRKLMGEVPAEKQVIFVIDALNQLDEGDRTRNLEWLPDRLPPNVGLVISCTEDPNRPDALLQALRQRRPVEMQVGPLTLANRKEIVKKVPLLSAKSLDEDLIELLLANPATVNPLYLLVALEELRGFGSHEQLRERIAAFPQPGLEPELLGRAGFSAAAAARDGDPLTAIFTQVIERLEEDFDRTLVSDVLTLLACSRHGLAEPELVALTAARSGRDDLFSILRQLRPYLLSRAALTDFYHRNLAEAIRRYYFATPGRESATHARLAHYFRGRADPDGDTRWLGADPRGFAELPHHLAHAGEHARLGELLADLAYLDGRAALGDVYSLVEDYARLDPAPAAVEPLREFLRRHSQRLEENRGTFFALLYHEGPPADRRRAESLWRSGRWSKPWLRAEAESLPTPSAATSADAIEVAAEFDHGFSPAVGLAGERGLAFFLKRLGQIGVVEVGGGHECPYTISVRRSRLLGLAPNGDGRHLAALYETGELDWVRVTYGVDGTPTGEKLVRTARYLVPEFEPPVVAWNGDSLLYQAEAGSIVLVDADGKETSIDVPGDAAGELSGAVVSNGKTLLTFRQSGGTSLVVAETSGTSQLVRKEHADVQTVGACGPGRVAVAFNDCAIVVFELQPFREAFRVTGERFATCLAFDGERLLWVNDRGKFFVWRPGSGGGPERLTLVSAVVREDSIARARRLAARPDGTFDVVADTHSFRCAITGAGAATTGRIQDAFQTPDGEAFATETRTDGWWLRRGGAGAELALSQLQHRYFFGIDGSGTLLATSALGQGAFVEPAMGRAELKPNMPAGIGSIVGDPTGEFWLATRAGVVFHIARHGYRQAAEVGLENARQAQLVCAGPYLVWYGGCDHQTAYGNDTVPALIFFRRHEPKTGLLTLVGRRFFDKLDGSLQTVVADPTDGRLWTAHQGGEHGTAYLRRGTVDDFLHNREQQFPLPSSVRAVQIRVVAGGALWLLDSEGTLHYFNSHTVQPVAALAPALPFGALQMNAGVGSGLLVVQHQSRLVRCTIEGLT
jgi:hypothetical protein